MKRRKWRPKLGSPEPLDGVITRAGEHRFSPLYGGRGSRSPITDRQWVMAVGARIADRARPLTLERGVLTVRAATSVWASELSLLSAELLIRLAALGFDVREIRFRVGAIEPPARPPQRRTSRKIPPPAELAPELAHTLAQVGDDELRDTLERAARATLAWQAPPTTAPEGTPASLPPRTRPAKDR